MLLSNVDMFHRGRLNTSFLHEKQLDVSKTFRVVSSWFGSFKFDTPDKGEATPVGSGAPYYSLLHVVAGTHNNGLHQVTQ